MSSARKSLIKRIGFRYTQILRFVVNALVYLSGACILFMIAITCANVISRRFGAPIKGTLDLVKISSALMLSFALPYTTAVKGHVAIEYFFHKLGHRSRIVVDTLVRLLGICLFTFLALQSVLYGNQLMAGGLVVKTLNLPLFWVPWVMGTCSFLVVLVIAFNMVHPGREMIKP